MNQLDAIRVIGDALTDIDVTLGRLSPSSAESIALMKERERLDAQQRQLVRLIFDEDTVAFQNAGERLKDINNDLKKSIDNIQHSATLLADVTKFVDAAAVLVSIAAKLV